MRTLSVLAALLGSLAVATALPSNVCSPDTVALELRPMNTARARSNTGILADYQLAFLAVDPHAAHKKADFIDIHYRVNNEDSVNLRVLTEAALINNEMAKQAEVNGIQMEAGDTLRAYATYAEGGVACDTAIHTFSAPESFPSQMRQSPQSEMQINALAPTMRRMMRRPGMMMMSAAEAARAEEDDFWVQAAAEADENTIRGACPGIAHEEDVLRQAGLENSYVLSFENKTPARQLHFVDLHVNTGDIHNEAEWNNLRLASDMQLELAHKVMQPGVVVQPDQVLNYFWSYRTSSSDGSSVVDCSTEITSIPPHAVTHEVRLD